MTDEAGVLTCCEASTVAATGEPKLVGFPASHSEILVVDLPGLLRQLEPDRATGLLLADCCSIERIAVGHIIEAHRDHITAAQFAVDGKIEQREIAGAPFELQLRPDRPDGVCSQWRLRTDQLALLRWLAARRTAGWDCFILVDDQSPC